MSGASIYGLLHPETGELRYIGKANDPGKRLASHMRDSRRRNTPLYCWIRSLAASPVMLVLESDCLDWPAAERSWIARAKVAGIRLLNLAEGGEQPLCPQHVRRANAVALNAALDADPIRRRAWHLNRQLSASLRDGVLSVRARAKLRLAAEKRPDLFGKWARV